jgi:tetratricopeptide (TPR) repeat protein
MKFRVAVLALGVAAFSTQALSDPAYDLWNQGKYEEAIKAGLAEKTPEGLAVAARAAVSDMTMHAPPCLPCVERAEDLSRKALAADPKGALPTIYLAATLGYRGRIIGLMASQSTKLGEQSEQAIKDALALHPKNAQLIAAMGGWNFEVVRVGGSMLARWTYGATMDKGLDYYGQALKLSPNDLLINYQYGLGLAAYDPDEYHDKIVAAWKRAIAAPAQDAYDEAQKKRAAELLALLGAKDRKAFKAKLDNYMGIPQ